MALTFEPLSGQVHPNVQPSIVVENWLPGSQASGSSHSSTSPMSHTHSPLKLHTEPHAATCVHDEPHGKPSHCSGSGQTIKVQSVPSATLPLSGQVQVLHPSGAVINSPGVQVWSAQAISVQLAALLSPLLGQVQVLHPSSATNVVPGSQDWIPVSLSPPQPMRPLELTKRTRIIETVECLTIWYICLFSGPSRFLRALSILFYWPM